MCFTISYQVCDKDGKVNVIEETFQTEKAALDRFDELTQRMVLGELKVIAITRLW